jgi:hypothetical protein
MIQALGAALLLASSASATVHVFNVTLTGAEEVPPVPTPATGSATVTIDDRALTVTVSGTYSGLIGVQTLAHIHRAAPGVSGPIVVNLNGTGGTSGSFSGSDFLTPAQVIDALNGLHYLNVHSSSFGAGEIRGQVNGGQPGTRYCFPSMNGVIACPCAAPDIVPLPEAAPGHGCANSLFTNGAILSASGTASLGGDTLVLDVVEASNGLTIFMEGATNAATGVAFGDGVRCANAPLIRFGQQIGASGTASYPQGADPSISSITSPPSGVERYYATFYRNSAVGWCNAATFNITNSYRLTWTL